MPIPPDWVFYALACLLGAGALWLLSRSFRNLRSERRRLRRLCVVGASLVLLLAATLVGVFPQFYPRGGRIGPLPALILARFYQPNYYQYQGSSSNWSRGWHDMLVLALEQGRLSHSQREDLAQRVMSYPSPGSARGIAIGAMEVTAACGHDAATAAPEVWRLLESPDPVVREEVLITLMRIAPHEARAHALIRERLASRTTSFEDKRRILDTIPVMGSGALQFVPDLTALLQRAPTPTWGLDSYSGEFRETYDSQMYRHSLRYGAVAAIAEIGPSAHDALPAMELAANAYTGRGFFREAVACAREVIEGKAPTYSDAWILRLRSSDPQLAAVAASTIYELLTSRESGLRDLTPSELEMVRDAMRNPFGQRATTIILCAATMRPSAFLSMKTEIQQIADDESRTPRVREQAGEAMAALARAG